MRKLFLNRATSTSCLERATHLSDRTNSLPWLKTYLALSLCLAVFAGCQDNVTKSAPSASSPPSPEEEAINAKKARKELLDHSRQIQIDLVKIDAAMQQYALDFNLDTENASTIPTLELLVSSNYFRKLPEPPVEGTNYMMPSSWEDYPYLGGIAIPPDIAPRILHPDDPRPAIMPSPTPGTYRQVLLIGQPPQALTKIGRAIQNDLVKIDAATQQFALDFDIDVSGSVPTLEEMAAKEYFRNVPSPPVKDTIYQPAKDWDSYPRWSGVAPKGYEELYRHPDDTN